jgi:hypothetical protein
MPERADVVPMPEGANGGPMPERALQSKVKELHEAVAAGKPLSESQREALDRVLDEVETLLAEEGDDDAESLAERVREAGIQFEESHPNLTAAIGAVADALSRLGI